MENNMGLPLEFILTCKKTGRNSLGTHMLDLIPTANPLSGKSLYQIQGAAASNFDDEPVMRQATGFTDAAGKDVYFGDVIFMCGQSLLPDAFMIVSVNEWGEICAAKKDVGSMPARLFSKHRIVGNCYEPPARWLERAREIWPGAELPEGVRG